MIGIFKVNSKKDGGFYIDKYLKRILSENSGKIKAFVLQNEYKKLEGYNNINMNYKNFFKTIIVLKKIIKKFNIDIYYTNQFITLFYAIVIKKLFRENYKIIAKVDGKTIKLGKKRYFYLFYDILWDFAKYNADHVIFETQRAKGNYTKNNFSIIYTPATNFYNIEKKLSLTCAAGKNDLIDRRYDRISLFVGRYSYEKGYHLLEQIAKISSKVLFITIGGAKKEFEHVNNILELGYMTISKIIAYYQICDFLIVPSIDDSFPTVIREFSFFNKPIIATNVGSISEFKELGLSINLCEPNVYSICTEINRIDVDYKLNKNYSIYKLLFDPNNPDIIKEYIRIFDSFNQKKSIDILYQS